MPISSKLSDDKTIVTIQIRGRFDFNEHTHFRQAYSVHPAETKYVLDMTAADYMDSSALGMLLLLREYAGGDKADISIAGCRPDLKKILTIANFQKLFVIR